MTLEEARGSRGLVAAPSKLDEVLARLAREQSRLPYGRPRAVGLAELMNEVGFSERLSRIRTDSIEYTREGLKQLRAGVRPQPLDRDILTSFLRSRDEAMPPRSTRMSPRASELSTRSSTELGTLSDGDVPIPAPPGPPAHVAPALGIHFQHGRIHVDGEGDGLDYGTVIGQLFLPALEGNFDFSVKGEWAKARAVYLFRYAIPADGKYRFSTFVLASGTYALTADDGWPESKEALCRAYATVNSPKYLSAAMALFSRGDDNIMEADIFAGAAELSAVADVTAGTSLDLQVEIVAEVMARGEGSSADMDLTNLSGGFVCSDLTVTQL